MSKASTESRGRWQWVPPTLIVVGFAVFGLAQLMPGNKHPNRQDRLVDRASGICQAHVPAGFELGAASPTTAHEVVATAHLLRQPAAPWDEVAGDHFVARCSYTSPAAIGMSPTTICNGEIFNLSRPTQLLVDGDGRTSPDYGFESVPPGPCPLLTPPPHKVR